MHDQQPSPDDAPDDPGTSSRDKPKQSQLASSRIAQPGTRKMPSWNVGELPEAPRFAWRNWFTLLGPGLLMGGAAIGGGEWLMGPAVTARYGGALLWVATLSIVGQVIYNIEVSRYALYTGEPVFTGKLRLPPGPLFWVAFYLALDVGSFLPAMAANAATPLAAVLLGFLPDPEHMASHWWLLRILSYVVFYLALIPLVVGGKIYNSLKALISFKVFTVLGFLLFLGLFHSTFATWVQIVCGFFQFGTVPTAGSGTVNVFASLLKGEGLPSIDLSTIALLAALASIAGNGGLGNASISNYTRDQGWGMGCRVGAIPSVTGSQSISLSHVGTVFAVTRDVLPRWQAWCRHVVRDQVAVWMPACFLGMALPSMLSVQFLPRGTIVSDWVVAGMTADGVKGQVGAAWGPVSGQIFWYLVMFCGFLVLVPSISVGADSVIRRWVDIFWTASPRLRKLDPHKIRWVYFAVLSAYALAGTAMLCVTTPLKLLLITANIYNFALGLSCFHVLAVNVMLLPAELRPGWHVRAGMVLSGVFFTLLAALTSLSFLGFL